MVASSVHLTHGKGARNISGRDPHHTFLPEVQVSQGIHQGGVCKHQRFCNSSDKGMSNHTQHLCEQKWEARHLNLNI